MRKPIVAGNWKMNKTAAEAVDFVRVIRSPLNRVNGVDVVFCPPFLAIPAVADAVAGVNIGVGAQNMYFEESGAYTGEVAPGMLTPFCQYVILGHSERRSYFGETDELVNRKVKAALAHKLTPIICVGESLAQNEAGETNSFVSGQVAGALAGLSAAEARQCVFAYEPIWAIGTGRSASAAQAGAIIGTAVRGAIADLYDEATAQAIRVQYGGSVKPDNIADYMAQADIDGALVGGASLTAAFVDLVANAVS
ncbi:MAG: triose-phosphate isomerase [Anaerolineales bacterium]|nr:triose-phosphate isomerase [Anaerolineales bacterium]